MHLSEFIDITWNKCNTLSRLSTPPLFLLYSRTIWGMWWSVPEEPLSHREPHAGPDFSLAGRPQVCLCTSACSRCSWSGQCSLPRFLSCTCQVYLAYNAWIHIDLCIGPGARPLLHQYRDYSWTTGDTSTYPTPVRRQPVSLWHGELVWCRDHQNKLFLRRCGIFFCGMKNCPPRLRMPQAGHSLFSRPVDTSKN